MFDGLGLHLRLMREYDARRGQFTAPEALAIYGRACLRSGNVAEGLNLLRRLPADAPTRWLRRAACDTAFFDRELAQQLATKLATNDDVRFAVCGLSSDLPHPRRAPDAYLLQANAALQAQHATAWRDWWVRYWSHFQLAPPAMGWPPKLIQIQSLQLPAVENDRLPLVSVIMTVYNLADRISYAITSLLQQTYRHLEIIVVDDASEDGTAQELEALARSDARIRVLRNARNVGPYVSRNCALAHCRGEFITFHDADDWAHPTRIETHVRTVMRSPHTVASVSEWIRIDDTGRVVSRFTWPLTRLNPSSLLVRRTACAIAGAFDAVRTGADMEYLERLRLVFGAHAVQRLRIPLAIAAQRSASLTMSKFGWGSTDGLRRRAEYWDEWRTRHIGALDNPRALCRSQAPDVFSAGDRRW
ncbi:MAG: glycosyltransferase family 2 protein [Planctomycetota bacterium]|nr:glycosyltransferase family 2 protein [Planctomycetota bacterium]